MKFGLFGKLFIFVDNVGIVLFVLVVVIVKLSVCFFIIFWLLMVVSLGMALLVCVLVWLFYMVWCWVGFFDFVL